MGVENDTASLVACKPGGNPMRCCRPLAPTHPPTRAETPVAGQRHASKRTRNDAGPHGCVAQESRVGGGRGGQLVQVVLPGQVQQVGGDALQDERQAVHTVCKQQCSGAARGSSWRMQRV